MDNKKETSDDDNSHHQDQLGKKLKKTLPTCKICGKQFENMKYLKQHMQSHLIKQKCKLCHAEYKQLQNLYKHCKKVHGKEKDKKPKVTHLDCHICGKKFKKPFNLKRHMTRVHKNIGRKHVQAEFSCRHCNSQFLNYEQLFQHVIKNHPLQEQRGGRRASKHRSVDVNEIPHHSIVNNRTAFAPDTVGSSLVNGYTDMLDSTNDLNQSQQNDDPPDLDNNESSDEDEPVNNQVDESALGNRVINRLIHPIGNERYDLLTFFGNRRDQVRSFLHSRARQLRGIKWSLCVQVEMERIEEVKLADIRKVERRNENISINVFTYEKETIVPLRITEHTRRPHHVVCEDNRYTKPTVVYTGEDAGSKMIECLLKEEKQIREILSHIKPMDISEKEREDIISKANYCCICKKAFTFYDRTMENVRRYKAIEIIHTKKRLDKVTAKPTYKDTTILNEDLVAVELYKSTVNLVKPIYCGMSILGTYGGGARSTKVQLKRVRSDGKTVTIHSDLLNGAVLKIKRTWLELSFVLPIQIQSTFDEHVVMTVFSTICFRSLNDPRADT
ncbi:BLMP1-like protein [Mya arenaria]|uniref:BLMP1-like protein n=1 Tax=Mya arenaria TaxID=6604 RepID=A0ABY7F8Z8_MYAAR|nr:BLMP1-like protein [Mya arenaria]